MADWWNGLSLITQVYYCIAIAATAVLLIQSVLLFFGVGDHDADADCDGDGGFDSDGGMNLFTIRGIVAFFTMCGWTGVMLSSIHMTNWLVIILSIIAGTIALFVVAIILRAIYKMQSNGNISLANAIGKVANVYVPIHGNGVSGGKITLTFQGHFMELDAVTDDGRDYAVGDTVEVIGLRGDAVVVTNPKTSRVDKTSD